MSDQNLVHEVAVNGGATHAIVIGCGRYRHLIGGDAAPVDEADGMAQLTSPPVSARAVADWLIDDCSSNKPLATVSLLLSEADAQPYRNPQTGVEHEVQVASASNVEQAILDWAARAGERVENRTIFYFCGHGISAGVTTSLLLEDFGANAANKFNGALNFDELDRGMESVAASEQLFVVDACRVATSRLLAGASFVGIVPLAGTQRNRALPLRQSATLFSTILGAKAYGFPGEPSVYTSALIAALKGAGSMEDEEDGESWRVDTALLKRAIDLILKRRSQVGRDDAPPPQIGGTQTLMTFPIHDINGLPRFPVFVRCSEQGDNEFAEFACMKDAAPVGARPVGHAEDWELELEPGEYEFVATIANRGASGSTQKRVRPAFGNVRLEPT